jgi:hypothetical protein
MVSSTSANGANVQILSHKKVHTGIAKIAEKPQEKKISTEILRKNAEAYQAQAQDAVDERMLVHRKYELQTNINLQMLNKMIQIRALAQRMGDAGKPIIDILNS